MDYEQNSSSRWDAQSLSLTLGHVAGIRVRLHLTFLLLAAYYLLYGAATDSFVFHAQVGVILFGCVLLHEFGHCFGCRAVGGTANDILMWPLGGLALTQPPHRALDHLVTTASGPLVTLVFVVGATPLVVMLGGGEGMWDPFDFTGYHKAGFAYLVFKINYALLLLNLLPIMPLDGGQIVRELIWLRQPLQVATRVACIVGMAAAVLTAGVSLWNQSLLVAVIALVGFLHCLQTFRMNEMMGDLGENEFGYDFSQGYTSLERSMSREPTSRGPSIRQRIGAWRERRRRMAEESLEAEVDRILAKISENGMESLTRNERRLLTRASRKRQQSRNLS